MKLYFKKFREQGNPKTSGSYDTDKGRLFYDNSYGDWQQLNENDDPVSFQMPIYWYEEKIEEEPKKKKLGYFKKLKTHPGLGTATILTILSFCASAGNKSIHSWEGVLILGGCASAVVWSVVLLSNFKR